MQSHWWIGTIPHHEFFPYLPSGCEFIRGQLELAESGFLHWQLVVRTSTKRRLGWLRETFGPFHWESTRSNAAISYVWKEDTRVAGTQFELGERPMRRNSKVDWEAIWQILIQNGKLSEVPASIRICNYSNLRRIIADHAPAIAQERVVHVFWGATGTGKSRDAWEQAGLQAYPKAPTTKFWDGYHGQEHVVIDEFRGSIEISHLLRWFDRYPVYVEIKGSSVPYQVKTIWITSNLEPRSWYPELDSATLEALMRRLRVVHYDRLVPA